jgi:hypothetical protein
MNINVIVVNLNHDLQPPTLRHWGRSRQGDYSRTSVTPDSHVPVEEVIELTPQNGVWVGDKEVRDRRGIEHGDEGRELRMLNYSSVTTYDQNGRLNRSVEGKGLRVDIVA